MADGLDVTEAPVTPDAGVTLLREANQVLDVTKRISLLAPGERTEHPGIGARALGYRP